MVRSANGIKGMRGFEGGKRVGKKYIGRGCKVECGELVRATRRVAPTVTRTFSTACSSGVDDSHGEADDAGGTNQRDLLL